jgi:hypothetical protein
LLEFHIHSIKLSGNEKKRLAGHHYRPAGGVLATDLEKFWTTYPASVGEQEFLLQVGHTVNGRPYSKPQLEAMIVSIHASRHRDASRRDWQVATTSALAAAPAASHPPLATIDCVRR